MAEPNTTTLLRLIDTLEGRRAPYDPPGKHTEMGSLDPHAIAIAKDGKVLWEAAWEPYSLDHAALVYSASKTYTSMAIGFLLEEGLLSLDDDPGAILDIPNPHGLTMKHLLTMNTGHERATIDAWPMNVRVLFATAPEHAPGTFFAYNSHTTHTLSAIVKTLTGQQVTEYLRTRLFNPLRIGPRWMRYQNGVEQGFSGLYVTVRDLLATGITLCDKGRLEGRQIIPASYVEEMQRPWSDTADDWQAFGNDLFPEVGAQNWGAGYGYQVWCGREGFRLDGAFGQFCLVIPERGIVIAYQGATNSGSRTMAAFWEFIDAWTAERAANDDGPAGKLETRTRELDSWDSSTRFNVEGEAMPPVRCWRRADGMLIVEGKILGLSLSAPLEVGEGRWNRIILPAEEENDERFLPLAIRGDEDANGTVLIHIVVTSSPHRLLLTGKVGEELRVAWHTTPLRFDEGEPLAVPRVVVEPSTSSAARGRG